MNRRLFAKALLSWPLLVPAGMALATIPKQKSLFIQNSPVAGFQYHRGNENR